MNFLNLDKENRLIKYFIIFGWISCWFSISFNPEFFYRLQNYKDLNFNLYDVLNLIRGISILIIFPVLLLVLLKLINQKNILYNSNFFFFLIFSIFFLIQIIGLIITNNPTINAYYLINSINIIGICFIFKNYFSEKELIIIFKINFFILIGIFIFFGSKYVIQFLNNDYSDFYGIWGSIYNSHEDYFDVPRPTGLSRTALIVLIISSLLNTRTRNQYLLQSIVVVLSVFFMLALGSRTILLIYILYLFFYIYFKKIFTVKKSFFFLFKFIIMPILITALVSYISIQKTKLGYKTKSEGNFKVLRKFPKIKRDKFNTFSSDKLNTFSSGRLNDWKAIIKNNQNIILGNGVMGDRYLIKQSASNLIIYSYASSGILGVFLVIYIYLYTFFFSILTIIRKPNDSCLENYKLISIVCLFVLMLRSILETSYGIFGIDLILFCFFISLTAFEKNK